jgi:uncharacterized membrane protein SpoIIM required for sporulation
MRAESLGAESDVVRYLNRLAARAHNSLYGPPPFPKGALSRFLRWDFPRSIRRHQKFVWLSAALFVGAHVFGTVGALASEDFALRVLPPESLEQMLDAYSSGFDAGRDEGQDALMTGFYVNNNIGIAFRCFATGIFFGLGSAFFLIYNGLVIGTVLGHVSASGYAHNILTLICGHGWFELTAIVVSGAAGLKMGYALVATGGLTRFASLKSQASELSCLIVGAALMLAIAALIEGFWSPSAIPAPIKWGFSLMNGLLLYSYFALAGRSAPREGSRS